MIQDIKNTLYRLTIDLFNLSKEETYALEKQKLDYLQKILRKKDAILKILHEHQDTVSELRKLDPDFNLQHTAIHKRSHENNTLMESMIARTQTELTHIREIKGRTKNVKSAYAPEPISPKRPRGSPKINSTA